MEIKNMTDNDIGRKVIYQCHPTSKIEEGRITSFNDRWVFVDYDNSGRGQATPADKLKFVND